MHTNSVLPCACGWSTRWLINFRHLLISFLLPLQRLTQSHELLRILSIFPCGRIGVVCLKSGLVSLKLTGIWSNCTIDCFFFCCLLVIIFFLKKKNCFKEDSSDSYIWACTIICLSVSLPSIDILNLTPLKNIYKMPRSKALMFFFPD